MKKIIILIIIITSLKAEIFSQSTTFNSQDAVIKTVENFNYAKYLDSTIHSLIVIDPINSYSQYNYITDQPSVISGLKLKFSDDVFVEIYVGALTHQKSYNPTGNWNFDLLLNEKIMKVRVMVNGQVYKEKGKVL